MTATDSRTFTFAAVLLLCTSALRFGVEISRGGPTPGDSASALPQLLAQSERAQEDLRSRSRPLAPGERIDPNRATEAELDRLPGVGPSLAAAIVASRTQEGPFEAFQDLLRVRGIGAATLTKLEPHLVRSLVRAQPAAPRQPDRPRGPSDRSQAPGSRAPTERVDLNRADAQDLEALPGVGPALAARILELRGRLGRFSSVDQLTSVRGIGATTVERLRPLVRARP